MAELADAWDLKSQGLLKARAGSNPAPGIVSELRPGKHSPVHLSSIDLSSAEHMFHHFDDPVT